MTKLRDRVCTPIPQGTPPLDASEAARLLAEIDRGWRIAEDGLSLRRAFAFPDFYRTMAFVNALAWIANEQDHHPDLEVGYSHCRVAFSTHTVGGLSVNDFICAARIDAL